MVPSPTVGPFPFSINQPGDNYRAPVRSPTFLRRTTTARWEWFRVFHACIVSRWAYTSTSGTVRSVIVIAANDDNREKPQHSIENSGNLQ